MSSEARPEPPDDEATPATAAPAIPATAREPARHPWVTWIAIVWCGGVFIGLTAEGNPESWETLAKYGFLSADAVWDHGYWALVTSVFVHLTLWHLAFNVYWLWALGSRLERAIGSLRYLGFFLVASVVSSACELAAADSTGIGASGVVYAIFGFMWLARHHYGPFKEVLDPGTIRIFVLWLLGCVVATYFKIWEVGNAAHISGLVFGAAVANAWVLRIKPRLTSAGLAALLVASIVPLFWCPWSVTWLSHQAYAAHTAEHYQLALDHYTRIIHLDPHNAWAYLNRSSVYQSLGQMDNAESDYQKAGEIDPSLMQDESP